MPLTASSLRALVTRPREDSEAVAAALVQRGLEVMIEPLLDIEPVPGAVVEAEGTQGILVTSANGIRALARLHSDRALPVWTVGDASARVARDLGYAQVESAGGDVDTLADLVAAKVDPAKGVLLHAAGTVNAGDLAGRLGALGFQVRRQVLYQAVTATALTPDLSEALKQGRLDLALFFSPRTAATFVRLARAAGLGDTCARIKAYGLSANVSAQLAPLPWAVLRQAAEPTQAALLALLDDDLSRRTPA
ncbi:uroporphyrinogen-III synthase [Paramagnetospirillum marisnigri]|uniref:Uroporphyrinogen-III synthase n=1 Tax=Paramagnetospirillum marisnigri TaxID=1285242 RepID=A0A178MKM9_9PROT|nr:uroporphyrinogen-III synthase [Paramagnetospirillum marisnigri]OAN49113.1 uroporphyrinogen-III synthase [Paramagnetospirillum marisnigri]